MDSLQLLKISSKIRSTLELDTIWQETVTSLGKAFQVSRCIICSYKLGQSKVKVEAEYCQEPFPSILGRQLELEAESNLKQALVSNESVVVEQVTDGHFQQQSVLVVSTSHQDEPNGVLSLKQCDHHRQWSEAEIELVRELAQQVGTAIAHATLYKELEVALKQAEAVSCQKSEFLISSTDKLRTPLNGIIGSLKLILDEVVNDPEEQMEFIDVAHDSALHLMEITNEILDIAKLETGKMELELGQVKLKDLMEDVDRSTRNQAQHKNLSFNFELPTTRDEIIVFGNYQRLLQVLLHLVGNAIKFTHKGGVIISAEVQKTKLKFKDQDFPGMVKVRVSDTGIGISLEEQEMILYGFTQVDGSITPKYRGTGLGLTISQKLIQAMGSELNFYSLGKYCGLTVVFSVPLYQDPLLISQSDFP